MSLTLDDFEVRYVNLKGLYPELKQCSVYGCRNPRDVTLMGVDSSCSYHRLLFDAWLESLTGDQIENYLENQRARRSAFTRWRNKLGKEACDAIVLRLAQEPINWEC